MRHEGCWLVRHGGRDDCSCVLYTSVIIYSGRQIQMGSSLSLVTARLLLHSLRRGEDSNGISKLLLMQQTLQGKICCSCRVVQRSHLLTIPDWEGVSSWWCLWTNCELVLHKECPHLQQIILSFYSTLSQRNWPEAGLWWCCEIFQCCVVSCIFDDVVRKVIRSSWRIYF